MELTQTQYGHIADYFPKHRSWLAYSNLQAVNAFLYIAENGCKWRALPGKYGNWHTNCYRISCRAKNGVIDRVFAKFQEKQTVRIRTGMLSMDGTGVKIHPVAASERSRTAFPSHKWV